MKRIQPWIKQVSVLIGKKPGTPVIRDTWEQILTGDVTVGNNWTLYTSVLDIRSWKTIMLRAVLQLKYIQSTLFLPLLFPFHNKGAVSTSQVHQAPSEAKSGGRWIVSQLPFYLTLCASLTSVHFFSVLRYPVLPDHFVVPSSVDWKEVMPVLSRFLVRVSWDTCPWTLPISHQVLSTFKMVLGFMKTLLPKKSHWLSGKLSCNVGNVDFILSATVPFILQIWKLRPKKVKLLVAKPCKCRDGMYYGLNVYVLPKLVCWSLIPNIMVFGGGTFGEIRSWGGSLHEWD